jgi:hypothetical protein
MKSKSSQQTGHHVARQLGDDHLADRHARVFPGDEELA